MPYSEVIHNVKQCKAILELISDGQTGITQRPYEAMHYGKKLITNNREVMQYSFYTPEQFFIFGERPIHELKAFLQQQSPSIRKQSYTFERWLQGFTR